MLHFFRILGALLVSAVLVAPSPAGAQANPDAAPLDVERLHSPADRHHAIVSVPTTGVPPAGAPVYGVQLHRAHNPLEAVARRDGETRTVPLVASRTSVDVAVAVGLLDRFSVGLQLPLVAQRAFRIAGAERRPVAPLAFGDLRATAKWQFLRPESLAAPNLALSLPTVVPVGDTATYNSAGGFALEPRLIADWGLPGGTRLAATAGYALRPRQTLVDRASDDTVTWSAGGRLPVGLLGLHAVGEVFGHIPVPSARSDLASLSHVEALAGLQRRFARRTTLRVAAGTGFTDAVGSPDLRLLASLSWAGVARDADGDDVPDRRDACPDEQEDLDGFRDGDGCLDADNDRDGLPDDVDECPDEPEDPDGYEDDDGCPDPDNDGDGVPDVDDHCPLEPGPAAHDGCPVVDSDDDGLPDDVDECPDQPEDKDGYEDDDGCPDPDNDGDGIPDDEDACPNEPEDVDGFEDGDGCPDEKSGSVEMTDEAIEIDEAIHFGSDRAVIEQRSYAILEEVAKLLKNHPDIRRLRVEGHTDARGRARYNLALSQRRADAVRAFLIDRGVDPDRLESRGYGESEPIAPNDTEEGRRKNRRVELTILERAGGDDE